MALPRIPVDAACIVVFPEAWGRWAMEWSGVEWRERSYTVLAKAHTAKSLELQYEVHFIRERGCLYSVVSSEIPTIVSFEQLCVSSDVQIHASFCGVPLWQPNGLGY